jgi:hypothetical protein
VAILAKDERYIHAKHGEVFPVTRANGAADNGKMQGVWKSGAQAARGDEFPETPPESVRRDYLSLSRTYVRWSLAMLVWALLCVGYFILTRQAIETGIGICLGLLLIAMTIAPALFFGGETWHKRLGWITILTVLFAVMSIYPLTVVASGIWRRMDQGRYRHGPSFNDGWHLILSALTVLVFAWTIVLAVRGVRIVQRLRRGDYPPSNPIDAA